MTLYRITYINFKYVEQDYLYTTDPNFIVRDLDDVGGQSDGQAIFVHPEHYKKDIEPLDGDEIIAVYASQNCDTETFNRLYKSGEIVEISD